LELIEKPLAGQAGHKNDELRNEHHFSLNSPFTFADSPTALFGEKY